MRVTWGRHRIPGHTQLSWETDITADIKSSKAIYPIPEQESRVLRCSAGGKLFVQKSLFWLGVRARLRHPGPGIRLGVGRALALHVCATKMF